MIEPSHKEDGTGRPNGDQLPVADDGVDVTLIRWMLSLTPRERLAVLKQNVAALQRLRDARTRK